MVRATFRAGWLILPGAGLLALALPGMAGASGAAGTRAAPRATATTPTPRATQRTATRAPLVTVGADGSHILGTPNAPVMLTEFVSYTCSHCADFTAQATAPLRAAYIAPGRVRVEIRHLVRDPLDMAMAVAANCGANANFFARHEALMASQNAFLDRARALPAAAMERWRDGDVSTRLRRVADDTGVTGWMRQRGFTPQQISTCMTNRALQAQLVAQTNGARDIGVTGTPGFTINTILQADVHSWAALQPLLDAAVRQR